VITKALSTVIVLAAIVDDTHRVASEAHESDSDGGGSRGDIESPSATTTAIDGWPPGARAAGRVHRLGCGVQSSLPSVALEHPQRRLLPVRSPRPAHCRRRHSHTMMPARMLWSRNRTGRKSTVRISTLTGRQLTGPRIHSRATRRCLAPVDPSIASVDR